ncbi:MAG: hypothetical protein V3S55_15235 [Nitrospiraceae bacterium]
MRRIQSDFALLDVKQGRAGLNKKFKNGAEGDPLPIVIHGSIVGVWGSDDGISQEFTVKVDKVKITTSDPVGAVELLKELKSAIGDGGLRSGFGWDSCDHCHGWPDHKLNCIIRKVDKFLKGVS